VEAVFLKGTWRSLTSRLAVRSSCLCCHDAFTIDTTLHLHLYIFEPLVTFSLWGRGTSFLSAGLQFVLCLAGLFLFVR